MPDLWKVIRKKKWLGIAYEALFSEPAMKLPTATVNNFSKSESLLTTVFFDSYLRSSSFFSYSSAAALSYFFFLASMKILGCLSAKNGAEECLFASFPRL